MSSRPVLPGSPLPTIGQPSRRDAAPGGMPDFAAWLAPSLLPPSPAGSELGVVLRPASQRDRPVEMPESPPGMEPASLDVPATCVGPMPIAELEVPAPNHAWGECDVPDFQTVETPRRGPPLNGLAGINSEGHQPVLNVDVVSDDCGHFAQERAPTVEWTPPPPPDACVPSVSASPRGVTIAEVERPWRLLANAGLSYRSAFGSEAGSTQDLGVGPSLGRVVAPPDLPEQASAWLGRLPAVGLNVDGDPQVPSDDRRSIAEPADRTRPRSERSAPTESTWQPMPAWPQRLLRWTEDGEGATAWIRDFNLAPDEHASLVTVLRGLADAQRISLRRIMLNGHVLWRSPSR